MAVVPVSGYMTSDNVFHDDAKKARYHEAVLQVKLSIANSLYHKENPSPVDIISLVTGYPEQFIELCQAAMILQADEIASPDEEELKEMTKGVTKNGTKSNLEQDASQEEDENPSNRSRTGRHRAERTNDESSD